MAAVDDRAHAGPAEQVGGHRRPEQHLVQRAAGVAADQLGRRARRGVRDLDPARGIRLARRQPAALEHDPQLAGAALHHEQDHRALRPAAQPEHPRGRGRVPREGREPREHAGLVGQDGPEQAHRVRAAAVAHNLDLRLVVGMDRGGDRDAAREVLAAPQRRRAHDHLGVRPHSLADPRPADSG